MDSRLFWPFFNQKTAKKNKKRNWQNPKHLMKFSEIWYVNASQQKTCYKKTLFGFRPFLAVFNQKTAKKIKKNWQNLNRLKFSEIWYVDASQQKKCYKKTFFGFRPFLAVFQRKNSQN